MWCLVYCRQQEVGARMRCLVYCRQQEDVVALHRQDEVASCSAWRRQQLYGSHLGARALQTDFRSRGYHLVGRS